MAAIDMPATPGFTNTRFSIETNTQTFTSPLTKATQRMLLGGSRWIANYSLPAMNAEKGTLWQAFFMLLEGSVNTFNAYDPDKKTPRGPMGGTPLVKGASQTGSSLAIDGCTPNIVGWGRAGDMVGVNGELKMLTANCSTNGSGETTIFFKPALRSSPADNAPLTVTKPTCTMTLADDNQAAFDRNSRGIFEPKTFTAVEVFS